MINGGCTLAVVRNIQTGAEKGIPSPFACYSDAGKDDDDDDMMTMVMVMTMMMLMTMMMAMTTMMMMMMMMMMMRMMMKMKMIGATTILYLMHPSELGG